MCPPPLREEENESLWESFVHYFRSLSDCCHEDVAKQKYLSGVRGSRGHHYNRGEHRETERARSKARSTTSKGGKKRTHRENKGNKSSPNSSTATSKSITFEGDEENRNKAENEPFFSEIKQAESKSSMTTASTSVSTSLETSNDGADDSNRERAQTSRSSRLKTLLRRVSNKKNKNIPTDPIALGDPKGVKWAELIKLMPVSDDYDADFLAVRLQAFNEEELGARSRQSLNTILAYAAIRNDAIFINKILRRLDSFPDIQRDLIMKKNANGFSALDIAESLKSPLSVILAFRSVPGLESIGNSTSNAFS
uniref:Uncharacterized protein n=1 Tax=Aureoumbra lagunensis TaxID=44058 RepID=A0A7S3JYI2_9STRA